MRRYLMKRFCAGTIILSLVLFAVESFAADHYIRAGATGANNGSSWADAWTSFSAVGTSGWVRGDTYYVAGGIYNGNLSIPSRPGNEWINIIKANVSENESDPGWNSAYASNQAVINGRLVISTSYIKIDGITGLNETGYGIKINSSSTTESVVVLSGQSFVDIDHLEIRGPGFLSSSTGYDGVYLNSTTVTKGIRIANCYIHEIGRNGITIGNLVGTSWSDYGVLFENNILSETGGTGILTPANHGQGMQISYAYRDAYLIIRNNIFRNIVGTGMIAYLAGGSTHTYSRIYNNVFYITDPSTYGVMSPGVISALAGSTMNYIYIYNNTFSNLSGSSTVYGRISLLASGITTAEVRNNLWIRSNLPYGGFLVGITAKSNNGFYGNTGSSNPGDTESTDPLFNIAGYDFRLRETANATSGGVSLASIFSTDIIGTPRINGYWSIGAYQAITGFIPPPNPPTNLRLNQ